MVHMYKRNKPLKKYLPLYYIRFNNYTTVIATITLTRNKYAVIPQ